MRTLLAAVLVGMLSMIPAMACDYVCGGVWCVPQGAICCGGNRYCEHGNICTQDGKCLSTSSPRYCGGNRYCPEGTICMKNGKCLPTDSPSYCGGRSYCDPGQYCTNDKKCFSMSSPSYCGGGHYCDQGYECAGQGKCRPMGGNSSTGNTGSDSDTGTPPVSDSCLVVGKTRIISGLIGECDTASGGKGHEHFTEVTSSGAVGCPKAIEFEYYDPDAGTTQSWFTPMDINICNGEPQNVHVKR